MMKFLLLSLICFVSILAFSQNFEYRVNDFKIEKKAIVDVSSIEEDWMPHVQHLEMPHPGGDSFRSKLSKLKQQSAGFSLRQSKGEITEYNAAPPELGLNFEGNLYNGATPNDNDLAISNNGKLVSVINTSVYIYDIPGDTLVANYSLATFAAPLNLPHHKYDPKIVYDPTYDKFIIVFLNGSLDSTSQVIVAFSQTNDPAGQWNLYSLPGNPVNNDTWSDYPVIGISEEELFIGINTFFNGSQNNSGFVESTFWQIEKSKGYSGQSLDTRYYDGLKQNGVSFFNFTPIQGGSSLYGPNMFILSNRNLAVESDTIFLLEVDNTIANNGQLSIEVLRSPVNYFLPPPARQRMFFLPNDTIMHTFDTNDSRILGGFMENDEIQFVASTKVPGTERAGIYHGFIANVSSNTSVSANILGDAEIDFGFPNISYSGVLPADRDAIITFNHSSPDVPSGFSSMYFANNNTYSGQSFVKEGTHYVNRIPGVYERWGDYTGSQRVYNEPGKVWAGGSYGMYNSQALKGINNTWVAELNRPYQVGIENNRKKTSLAYPNPTYDRINFQFDVDQLTVVSIKIVNLEGKLVKLLIREKIKKGINEISFSLDPLPPGTYILLIEDKTGIIAEQKIVKQ